MRLLRDAREDLQPSIRDPDCVQSRHLGPATRLDHLKPSNDGISISGLREPKYTVGYSEDGISLLLLGVLTEEKGGYFPGSQVKGETLNESVEVKRCPPLGATMLPADRSK
jgi:hypothetical protein